MVSTVALHLTFTLLLCGVWNNASGTGLSDHGNHRSAGGEGGGVYGVDGDGDDGGAIPAAVSYSAYRGTEPRGTQTSALSAHSRPQDPPRFLPFTGSQPLTLDTSLNGNALSGSGQAVGGEALNLLPHNSLLSSGQALGKTAGAGFGDGQLDTSAPSKDFPAFSSSDPSTLNALDNNGGLYGNGGSVDGGAVGGLHGGDLFGKGATADVGNIHAGNFATSLTTDFSSNSLHEENVDDANMYDSFNTGSFPSTVNNDQLPFPASAARTSGLGNNDLHQQTLNDVNHLVPTNANVLKGGSGQISLTKNSNPVTFLHNSADADSHYQTPNTAFPASPFPSTGGSKVNSNNAFTSSIPRQDPLSSSSSSTTQHDVLDGGKSTSRNFDLTPGQINAVGRGSNLVNDLLQGDTSSGLSDGNSFNVNGAFTNPVITNNAFGENVHSNLNAHPGDSEFGLSKKTVDAGIPYDGSELENQEDIVGKELDARSAALGFSGYSDSADGLRAVDPKGGFNNLYFSNGRLPSNKGLTSLPGSGPSSLRPQSDFKINTDVRGGYDASPRTGGAGVGVLGLGAGRAVGRTDPFRTSTGLDSTTFGGPSLGSRAGGLGSRAGGLGSRAGGLGSRAGGLGSRVGGLDSRSGQSPFLQRKNRGQFGLAAAFSERYSPGEGLTLGDPGFASGKQLTGSSFRNKALNLAPNTNDLTNRGVGSDFNRQDIKSSIWNGNTHGTFKPVSGSAFNQNGLVSKNDNSFKTNQGLGEGIPQGLNSNKGFKLPATFPRAFNDGLSASSGKGLSFNDGLSASSGKGLSFNDGLSASSGKGLSFNDGLSASSGKGLSFNDGLSASSGKGLSFNDGLSASSGKGLSFNDGLSATSGKGLSFNNGLSASSGKGLSFGSTGGTGRGTLVSQSSGKSSFSSSSTGSGLGRGNGLNLGHGSFTGGDLGAGNSLRGVSLTGRGLNPAESAGRALVGSSRKVYDSGLVGSSTSLTGGGRKSYSNGNGSSISRSSSSSYSNSDFGGDGNSGTSSSVSDYDNSQVLGDKAGSTLG